MFLKYKLLHCFVELDVQMHLNGGFDSFPGQAFRLAVFSAVAL